MRDSTNKWSGAVENWHASNSHMDVSSNGVLMLKSL